MKKTVIILMAMMVSFAMTDVKAQSLGDIVKSAASSAASAAVNKAAGNSSAGKAASSIVSGLLGTKTVNATTIQGTWSYSQPAIVFESSNLLSNATAKTVSSKIGTTLQTYLNKVGVKKGALVLTLSNGGTGTLKANGQSFPLKWTVSGSNLNISLTKSLSNGQKSFSLNVNLNSNKLQLAMKADKVLELLKSVCANAGSANSYMSTINTLMKSVDGLYLGLQFTK